MVHLIHIFADPVENPAEPVLNSFYPHQIDLDVPFHMHRIELFDLAHVKSDV